MRELFLPIKEIGKREFFLGPEIFGDIEPLVSFVHIDGDDTKSKVGVLLFDLGEGREFDKARGAPTGPKAQYHDISAIVGELFLFSFGIC